MQVLLGKVLPWLFLIGLCVTGCLFIPQTSVYADGGAPNLAYISGTAKGISAIDIAQRKVTTTLTIAGKPGTILLSVDGRLLYVTQPELNRVSVIATKTQQTICTNSMVQHPTLLTLDAGTNILYFAGALAGRVIGIDPLTCGVKRTIQVNNAVFGLAVATVGTGLTGGNGNQLWVADTTGLNIFSSDGKPLKHIPLPARPQYLCIPSGPTAYVTTQQGELEAVNLQTYRVSAPLLTDGVFGPMDYDAVTGEVYVPDLKHQRIDVLGPVSVDASSLPREPRRTFSFSSPPRSVAITSDGQLGFVALQDGNVAMLDVPGRQIVTTIPVGGSPQFIITGLYPSLLSFTPQQFSLFNLLLNSLHYVAAGVILVTAIVAILIQKRRQSRFH